MSNATATETRSIHLQAVGAARAMTAAEFDVGDVTMWNFGSRYMVAAIREVSACFLEFDLVNEKDGTVWKRKLKKDRLVAFSLPFVGKSGRVHGEWMGPKLGAQVAT